ncbi:MAG: hypothetical protein GY832_01185 [Chloroflexi bacterium]|nr:hypothetical protein [Chloroflexota bacterium]
MSTHNRSINKRSRDAFRQVIRELAFDKRRDTALVLGLLATLLLLLCGGGGVVIRIVRNFGGLTLPLVQPLADERILENVRDDLETHQLLTAAFDPTKDRLLISQEGGIIHSYDPVTHLWTTQRPFSATAPISADFVLLRSGCGDAVGSLMFDDCPDKRALWALGADGSLARYDDEWRIIVNNSRFTHRDGRPVADDKLVAAAVSDSGRWLLLGTNDTDLGLYDTIQHKWLPSSALTGQFPNEQITHIVWWRDYFWVGTLDGLFQVEIDASSMQAIGKQQLDGRIIDLDTDMGVVTDTEGNLWVLAHRDCKDTTNVSGCIWLGTFSDPDSTPADIVNQQNLYTNLNLSNLTFAQHTGHILTLSGQEGIYNYNTHLHSWEQVTEQPVITTLPFKDGAGFYFAQRSGVGVVRGGHLDGWWEWPDSGVTTVTLRYGKDEELLALTSPGNLYSISTQSGEFSTLYEQGKTAIDPSTFVAAAAAGDTVIFASADGIVLHDTHYRQYADIDKDDTPNWLLDSDVQLVGSGKDIYALTPGPRPMTNIYAIHDPPVVTSTLVSRLWDIEPYYVSGPPQSTWAWGQSGIGVFDADGSVYHITPQNAQRVAGAALLAGDWNTLRDVAGNDDTLAIIGGGMALYDLDARTWSSSSVSLMSGEDLEEVISVDGRWLLRTSRGRLIDNRGNALIGDQDDFDMTDEELSDVMQRDQHLFLAGHGHINQYDLATRQIARTWEIANYGDVHLRGIVDDKPLALVNGKAAWGDTILSSTSGQVSNLSPSSSFIWTVRRRGENLYLMGHDQNDATDLDRAQCFFRNPTAGSDVGQIYDARALPNDLVAVLTNAGLKFYDHAARTWRDAPASVPQSHRVYYFDYPDSQSYLLLVTNLITTSQVSGKAQLTFIGVDSITTPYSCSNSRIDLDIDSIKTVRAVSVNESTGRVAWITSNGQIIEWRAGIEKQIIASEPLAPFSTELRRTFDRQLAGHLLFSTDATIWRYDLELHTWDSVALYFNRDRQPSIADITIEPYRDENIITVRTTDDQFYYAILTATNQSADLQLIGSAEVVEPPAVSADTLLDIQARVENTATWTIVSNNRILYFDPVTRNWERSEPFPPDNTLTYQRVLGRGLIVGDNQTSWRIAQELGPHPRDFVEYRLAPSDQQTAITSDGDIWRLSETGELLQCTVVTDEAESKYTCRVMLAPFSLYPDDVAHAFEWKNLVLFDTVSGLRALDKNSGQEEILDTAVANCNRITASATPAQDQLILYSDELNCLTVLNQDGLDTFDSAQYLLQDDQDSWWAYFAGDDWWHYDGRVFQSPRTVSGETTHQASIRLFVTWNSNVTGVASDGTPYYWNGSNLIPADRLLDRVIPSTNVDWLVHNPQNAWWVLSNNKWLHILPAQCVSDAITQSSATPTAEARWFHEPWLTPTPSLTPCYYLAGKATVSYKGIAEVHALENGVELIDRSDQGIHVIQVGQGQYDVRTHTVVITEPLYYLDDQWSNLQNDLHYLPDDGRASYDPIIRLRVRDNGVLVAQRVSGRAYRLAGMGALPADFKLPPALNVGWLRWNRQGGTFAVNTGEGERTFQKRDFIDEGQFLFERIDSVLVKGESEFHVANPYGLWVYTQPDLNLNDDHIIFYPTSLNLPITAAHGCFLSGGNTVCLTLGRVAQSPTQDFTFAVGDMHFRERIASSTVEVTITVSGIDLPGLASRGFTWDTNWRALAYSGIDFLIQSDAGIHNAVGLPTSFDAGPQYLALTGGILQSDGNGTAYFVDLGRDAWYQHDGITWHPNVPNPHANRTLIQDAIWEWMLRDNRLDIDLGGASHNFALTTQGGFGFNSDRLLAATVYRDALYVATKAFLEIAQPAQQIASLQARRAFPVDTNRLEAFHFVDGSTQLYSYARSTVLRWDVALDKFVPNTPDPDPDQRRYLVATDRLRFTLDSAQVLKEILVDNLVGNSFWEPYRFVDQRFPFDHVTAIGYFDGQLNVGSDIGLQVYSNATSSSFNNLVGLYDMRNLPAGDLVPVIDVGIPASEPDLLMARSALLCIERRAGQPFAQCTNPGQLDTSLQLSTPLWHWVTIAEHGLVGQYYDADGKLDLEPINMDKGRLPHDRLDDVIVCEDRAFTMWDRRWVTVHQTGTLALNPAPKSNPLDNLSPDRFICVDKDTWWNDATLPEATYFETTDHQLWFYDIDSWKPVTDTHLVERVLDYDANPPLFEHGRLRLRQSPENDFPFEFEHRGLDDQWEKLSWWLDNIHMTWNVGIDKWNEIIVVDDQVWVATPLGLVTVDHLNSGEAYIDANNVMIVREPKARDTICPSIELKLKDGIVLARCFADSDWVYQGDLSNPRPTGVFSPFDGTDPFSEQLLVAPEDTGYLEVRLTGRDGRSLGTLDVFLRGEMVSLVGGQFNFDTLNSVALFFDDTIELATDRFGWFQASRQSIHVADLERPTILDNAANYEAVGVTHDGDESFLCLAAGTDNYVRIDADLTVQQTAGCPEYVGTDEFWLYLQDDSGLGITALDSIGGRAERRFTEGRFFDDIVVGLPIAILRDNSPTYWLPTRAGVIEMDEHWRSVHLHAGPFDGLLENEAPTVLYAHESQTPAYLGYTDGVKLYQLDQMRGLLASGFWRPPAPVVVRTINNGPNGLLRIHWRSATGNGWSDVDFSGMGQIDNTFIIHTGDSETFPRLVRTSAGIGSEMVGVFTPGRATFALAPLAPYTVDLPFDGELLDAFVFDDRILIIGNRELLDLNLNTIFGEIVEQDNLDH